MMKTTLGVALVMAATPAFAGGQPDSLGVGAEYMLNGLTGGVSLNYDLGKFHLGGFLGLADDGDESTDYSLGGRLFLSPELDRDVGLQHRRRSRLV